MSSNTWNVATKPQQFPSMSASSKNAIKKESSTEKRYSVDEFVLDRELGRGAFGMVYLAKHIASGKYCALKQIDKKVTKEMGQNEHVKTEKKILTSAQSPYLLKAVCTFQDAHLAWLALEYCPGGDLRDFLIAIECFEEQEAVLYFAEMIMGVHDLHKMGYIHRDLKPANFLIDKRGHIKLADFGLSKSSLKVGQSRRPPPEETNTVLSPEELAKEIETRRREIWQRPTKFGRATLSPSNFHSLFKINQPMKKSDQRISAKISYNSRKKLTIHVIPEKTELRREYGHSIVGSPEYMSPEITEGRHQGGSYYGEEVDWWSLGCVFFEMIFGAPPFQGDTPEELFAQIDLWNKKLPIIFEENKEHITPPCYSLLTGFLCDPQHRLGRDIDKVKSHAFFQGLNWSNLLSMTPPFVPQNPPEMAFY